MEHQWLVGREENAPESRDTAARPRKQPQQTGSSQLVQDANDNRRRNLPINSCQVVSLRHLGTRLAAGRARPYDRFRGERTGYSRPLCIGLNYA